MNIRPEKLDFKEQVRCFAQEHAVIAQHGAALANIIWMKPGSRVIEFNHDLDLDYFKIISQIAGHRYRVFKTDHEHATIDPVSFCHWLTKKRRSLKSPPKPRPYRRKKSKKRVFSKTADLRPNRRAASCLSQSTKPEASVNSMAVVSIRPS